MGSGDNIFDGTKISDLLQSEEYSDILRKHYKLWITSTNILERVLNNSQFIDTEALLANIENEIKFFVNTSAYYDSLELLRKEKVIILVGQPGVGKTTISKMLLLKYAINNYTVRYVSSNSLTELKNSLSVNPESKEIILLDDFLGSHYININDTVPQQIQALIAHIKQSPHKKLVLNSRITILNEVERKYSKFKNFIEDTNTQKYTINLDELNSMEKGEIFFNHMYFKEMPLEYFTEIISEKKYWDILNHNNYTPRLIEHITRKSYYEKLSSTEYLQNIIKTLNNPSEIWNDEFEDNIQLVDRLLLLTIYSFSDQYTKVELIENSFNNWLSSTFNLDITVNHFEICMGRLLKSMVVIMPLKDGKVISVINQSLNDFIYHKLTSTKLLFDNLLENITFFNQLVNLEKVKKDAVLLKIREFLLNNKFDSIISTDLSVNFYKLRYISDTKVCDMKLRPQIIEAFEDLNLYQNASNKILNKEYINPALNLLSDNELVEFYGLHSYLNNIDFISILVRNSNFSDIQKLIAIYEELYFKHIMEFDDIVEFLEEVHFLTTETLAVILENQIHDEAYDIVTEIISENIYTFDYYYYINEDDNDEINKIEKEIRQSSEYPLSELIRTAETDMFGVIFKFNSTASVSSLLDNLDLETLIVDHISYTTDDDNDDEHHSYKNSSSNHDEVDALFASKFINE